MSTTTTRHFGIQVVSKCHCSHSNVAARSAPAHLLKLWVRISSGAWMSVASVVCYQVDAPAKSWSLVQRSPTDCVAPLCVCVWSRNLVN